MEFAARLAVFEQCVKDKDLFITILDTILGGLRKIINLPSKEHSRILETSVFSEFLKHEEVKSFFKYIGFSTYNGNLVFRDDGDVKSLIGPAEAIEKKLHMMGSKKEVNNCNDRIQDRRLKPLNNLKMNNDLLKNLQHSFNRMLVYESNRALNAAKRVLPTELLQCKALERIRDQQMNIKKGTESGPEMSFEFALLLELMHWFKYDFFQWVDKPMCERCDRAPDTLRTEMMRTETEECRVEIYRCANCKQLIKFPRYNDPVTLVTTRRGRCGEWSNCFALLCRALGYDTRHVADSLDHVWCEVYDFNERRWLHVDPCENKIDTPLMYEHGWNKKLAYVFAVSKDDIQDVTWRYTTNHKEVMKRRILCKESDLLDTIMSLRAQRQSSLSASRKKFLETRCLEELLQLMVERQAGSGELEGRQSGSAAWRRRRGELGILKPHTFHLTEPGPYTIKYVTSLDKYEVVRDNRVIDDMKGWDTALYKMENVFRKLELDWNMVYLCREEDAKTGSLSWRLEAKTGFTMSEVAIKATTMLYEDGLVKWTVTFDDDEPTTVEFGANLTTFPKQFKRLTITAELTRGKGDVFWQHAQLFRQKLDNTRPEFEILTTVVCDG